MKKVLLSSIMAICLVVISTACGSSNKSQEKTINEDAVVDSVSTSASQVKSEISSETEDAMQEIDSLLSDI